MKAAALIFLYFGDLAFIGIYKFLFHLAQGPFWVHKQVTAMIKKLSDSMVKDYPGKKT